MALSYEFSIGSVRAKEKNLFTNSDIEHMLGCENVSSQSPTRHPYPGIL